MLTNTDLSFPVSGGGYWLTDLYEALVMSERRTTIARRMWSTDADLSEAFDEAELVHDVKGVRILARIDDALVYVASSCEDVRVEVAAFTHADADATLDEMQRRLPEIEPTDSPRACVQFWNWNGTSTTQRQRTIDTPSWEEIAGNYPSAVSGDLAGLMARTAPPEHGRLILWHGPPGTGKTHLIRALAYAWRDWCSTEYIVDCDQLLHGSSEYVTSLVLDGPVQGDDRWRLVVLEDAGEYLRPDSPSAQGQGFSRLLNTLDGMLGQSARLMMLLTTNEHISALAPAISRPGRCAVELEIPAFRAGEAAEWLAARGHPGPVGAEATLADLYAVLRGSDPPPPRRAVGFAA